MHTIERLNSRQVCNPVFVSENDVTKVGNIERILVILQHFVITLLVAIVQLVTQTVNVNI